ncbi:MAG: hypothetical protein WA738_01780 [Candidatus Angelobacter sp.]
MTCKLLPGACISTWSGRAYGDATRHSANQMTDFYTSPNAIPETGIYRVIHAQHRLAHEVTLIKGQIFPPCAKCRNEVRFELVRGLPKLARERRGSVSLYSLPVLDEEEDSAGR